jgi:glucose/arabinose dehydrogenase
VFVPVARGRPEGKYSVFADVFRGRPDTRPGADHRPGGLALGLEGALQFADDASGRIWRVLCNQVVTDRPG